MSMLDRVTDIIMASTSQPKGLMAPYSIYLLLHLLHEGSSGESRDIFAKFFKLDDNKSHISDLLSIYNVLNYDGLLETDIFIVHRDEMMIKKKFTNMFGNKLTTYSFNDKTIDSLVDFVNSMIYKKTYGRISRFLRMSNVTQETRLILGNTTYFCSKWLHPFKKHRTKPFSFTTSSSIIFVNMMFQSQNFHYYENDDLQYLEMPYENENYVMSAILLKNNKSYESSTNHELFKHCMENAKVHDVSVFFPKFTHRHKLSLKKLLSDNGLDAVFPKMLLDNMIQVNHRRSSDHTEKTKTDDKSVLSHIVFSDIEKNK